MKFVSNFLQNAVDIGKIILISAIIIIPVRTLIFQPFFVRGASMEPSFYNGDYLLIDELSYRFHEPQRGDVIVFRPPASPDQYYIKRIIGLPGEKVVINYGKVTVFDGSKEITLDEPYISKDLVTDSKEIVAKPGEYIVFGDNRAHSADSRVFGSVPKKNIIGKAFVTAWPLKDFSVFAAPAY